MSVKTRSDRALIGFLAGGAVGYIATSGNLLWTIIAGIIGAVILASYLE